MLEEKRATFGYKKERRVIRSETILIVNILKIGWFEFRSKLEIFFKVTILT